MQTISNGVGPSCLKRASLKSCEISFRGHAPTSAHLEKFERLNKVPRWLGNTRFEGLNWKTNLRTTRVHKTNCFGECVCC